MCVQRKLETDVLVVGSGAVGVAAGIEAREAGASVIILEKEDILGGAAAISGGGCALVDTALQREAGNEDSHDQAFEDWIRQGQGSADEVWARFYIERSNDALFEWAKDRGVEWVAARRNEGNTVARWHLPNGGGRGLWNALYKTAQGVRFHNEDLSGGGSGSVAVMAQNPAYCWSVLDSTMTDGITVSDPQYNLPGSSVNDPDKIEALLHESPSIKSGETLEALASEIGLPVDIFIETVNRYNSAIDQGLEREPDFGRSLSGKKMIERPPLRAELYAVGKEDLWRRQTDLHCQAVDKHYHPIRGLYAAGELAGMAGGHINGKAGLEGTMLGPALFSGRVAGAWAASDAGFGDGFQ